MSFWSAMVAIVAILAFTSARIARYRTRVGDPAGRHHAMREMASQLPQSREVALEKEVDDLRQRIAVLERIATEDRHSKAIAQEIESLRNS